MVMALSPFMRTHTLQDARKQSWQAHGRLTTPSDSKCKILAAKMNEMLVTAAGCSASGGALQTDGTCGCKKGYFRGELYNSTAANFTLSTYTTLCTACPPYTFQDQDLSNVTKCSNASVTTCSDAGDPNPTTGMCDCDPGIQVDHDRRVDRCLHGSQCLLTLQH